MTITPKIDPNKEKAISMALETIQKQYGKGSIMRLGEKSAMDVEVLKTNIATLDLALGVGGIPKGRIIEIFGPEASGKTTLCLTIIAQAQKEGGVAAFIDAEHAIDPSWARTLGVKLDDLLISQPDNGEQALEIAETLIRSGGVDVLVIDSVAALVPRSEIEGEMGDSQMGVQARLMSQALRKLTSVVSKSNTIVIFTNQIRLKIGVMFGNPETTPGGMAMKFYSSIRIDVRKTEQIKKGDVVVGSKHKAKIVKNKVAPPFKVAVFTVNQNGVDKEDALIEAAIQLGIFSLSGSFVKYNDTTLGQGKAQVADSLRKDTKLRGEIEKTVYKKGLSSNAEPSPTELPKNA